MGFSKHKTAQATLADVWGVTSAYDLPEITAQEYPNALLSLGTLGGGNHFIEFQVDSTQYLWVMIHSGSRNLGKKICDYYNEMAVDLNRQWWSSVPAEHELAFLPCNSEEGKLYISEMEHALTFAKHNRMLIMDRIRQAICQVLPGAQFDQELDIHHNYAALEYHDHGNFWVHRKGATQARFDQLGIIPGSQGTASYIVKGLGNPKSFQSCSHGAGRAMGRKAATRDLDLAAEQKRLDDKGILHAIRGQQDLEEAAGAYKDIDIVMEEQKDLVEVVYKLEPIGVIKG
jgi:tRNA-splicing ligase RtcB